MIIGIHIQMFPMHTRKQSRTKQQYGHLHNSSADQAKSRPASSLELGVGSGMWYQINADLSLSERPLGTELGPNNHAPGPLAEQIAMRATRLCHATALDPLVPFKGSASMAYRRHIRLTARRINTKAPC